MKHRVRIETPKRMTLWFRLSLPEDEPDQTEAIYAHYRRYCTEHRHPTHDLTALAIQVGPPEEAP